MSVTLLATPLVVVALVNLAKRLGVSGAGWLALLAVVLGVALAVADYRFGGGTVTASGTYQSGGTGLILGLTAAGLYDVSSSVGSGVAAATATTAATTTGDSTDPDSDVDDAGADGEVDDTSTDVTTVTADASTSTTATV